MNKERRNQIKEIIATLDSASNRLDGIKDCEDDARDNIPENLEDTEMYRLSEDSSDAMSDAMDLIQSAISTLEEIT